MSERGEVSMCQFSRFVVECEAKLVDCSWRFESASYGAALEAAIEHAEFHDIEVVKYL